VKKGGNEEERRGRGERGGTTRRKTGEMKTRSRRTGKTARKGRTMRRKGRTTRKKRGTTRRKG